MSGSSGGVRALPFLPIILGMVLAAAFVLPFVGAIHGARSMAAGLVPVLAVLLGLQATYGKTWAPLAGAWRSSLTGALALLLLHGCISALVHAPFDLARFAQSLVFLALFAAAAAALGRLVRAVSSHQLQRTAAAIAAVLGICAVAGMARLAPFGSFSKPVLLFAEPSGFAQVAGPYLLYFLVISRGLRRTVLLLAAFAVAFRLESLTLLTASCLAGLLTFRVKEWLLLAPVAALAATSLTTVDQTYYTSRLRLVRGNDNLSSLAYLQGWERASLNVSETIGLGVGFQQFGIVGARGDIQAAARCAGGRRAEPA